jgi:hypothetical protein
MLDKSSLYETLSHCNIPIYQVNIIIIRNIVGLALGYSKSIVVDIGFCLQGNDEVNLDKDLHDMSEESLVFNYDYLSTVILYIYIQYIYINMYIYTYVYIYH